MAELPKYATWVMDGSGVTNNAKNREKSDFDPRLILSEQLPKLALQQANSAEKIDAQRLAKKNDGHAPHLNYIAAALVVYDIENDKPVAQVAGHKRYGDGNRILGGYMAINDKVYKINDTVSLEFSDVRGTLTPKSSETLNTLITDGVKNGMLTEITQNDAVERAKSQSLNKEYVPVIKAHETEFFVPNVTLPKQTTAKADPLFRIPTGGGRGN